MVTVIAARQCISVPPFMRMHKAHAHVDCCEAMHVCACLCVPVHKAHGHCDCCEAMHVCRLCVFAVCPVCGRSLQLLKHQDSSHDVLIFGFLDFLLCRSSTGWIIVW